MRHEHNSVSPHLCNSNLTFNEPYLEVNLKHYAVVVWMSCAGHDFINTEGKGRGFDDYCLRVVKRYCLLLWPFLTLNSKKNKHELTIARSLLWQSLVFQIFWAIKILVISLIKEGIEQTAVILKESLAWGWFFKIQVGFHFSSHFICDLTHKQNYHNLRHNFMEYSKKIKGQ